MTDLHATMMRRALELARTAEATGEVPVGAVVYDAAGTIWGEGYNLVLTDRDPTAHAEIVAMRAAAKARDCARLDGLLLAVTLEPCAMCAQAIAWARVGTVHYGADDPKSGGLKHGAKVFDQPTCHHRPQLHAGLFAPEAGQLLTDFFRARRAEKAATKEAP